MATLYIHIGTPKTGTSSIQNFLFKNQQALKKYGVSFPQMDFGSMKGKYKFRRNGNFLVYKSELPGDERKKKEEERWIFRQGFEVLKKEAEVANKIVISDESVWYRQNSRDVFWQEVQKEVESAGCQMKVVVYLRRQDLFAQALWNQSVKNVVRDSRNFEKYLKSKALESNNLDYYKTLSFIAGCIGKENLIVRVFEKDIFLRSKEGIYRDFLEAIGEDMHEEYVLPPENQNERLDGNFIEIKRLINQVPEYKEMPVDFIDWPIQWASSLRKPEKVSYFGYEDQLKYLQQFEESNRLVAEEFLGKKNGVLFGDAVERLPKWEINPDTMYQDIILLFTELAVAQEKQINFLNEHLKVSNDRLRELEKEVHNPFVHAAALIRRGFRKFVGNFQRGCHSI